MACVEAQTRLSIKNILLGTVFSEASPAILSYTVGFARRYGSTMSLTGAVSPRAICEIVRNLRVDLAVIDTATQELQKADLDSATEEILSTVPCPVLIIGPRVAQMELAEGELERILYVTDFTISSLDGVSYALALAEDHDAQLRFVHVAEETTMSPFHFGNSRTVAFRKRLESMVASGKGFLQKSESVVQEGDRAEGLVRIASNLHASLIVMSAGGNQPPLLWRTASQVIRRAHCPVLTVRGASPEYLRSEAQ
ncbi:MAG: universal stress protein [Acidobacteriia bacterium]|nr:universal stress protein [Terriglobia bacterium]